jgi:CHAD domain-containing protein
VARVPSCRGWGADDWRDWFERLLGLARGHLADLPGAGDETAGHVHEARKLLKRLRSGTRLLGEVVDGDCLRRNRLLFRDASRLLAGSRDGTVRLETFDGLVGRRKATEGEEGLVTARARLVGEAVTGEERAREGGAGALALLEQAAFPDEAWRAAGKAEVRSGLRRLLKRARREYRDLVDGRSREFHELRKRVKDLFYALQALPGDARGPRKRTLKSLRALEESLGLQNDLFVLEEWFRQAGLGPAECPAFWKASTRRDRKLRKAVLREGAVLESLGKSPKSRKAFAAA